uniref:Dynein assembly factor 2, axonemal homolog n=1 Tax=Schistocephalus solidus TaxID=70667 RepID=A0A0X3NPG1_SCHSO
MEERLQDLKLTRGEVERLQKAFKDPEFCKLFAEYAEEISNPENRKRYEEEIKLAEQGRGMDVEFVHPTPCYVLKTRHWPSVSGPPKVKKHFEDAPPLTDGQKVFINICSSDKLGKPDFVTDAQTGGDGPNKGVRWSIPHSFSPPVEDLDKGKKRCLVCDVVFHPETIEIASKSPAMRRLLEATAIEGIHSQFQLCLGPSKEHAREVWSIKTPHGGPKGQADILKCVRTLKGVTQKGPLRPTIIRRKRADYDECQQRAQDEERAVFEAARTGPNPKASLAALAKLKASSKEAEEQYQKLAEDNVAGDSRYKVPTYKITHSTNFDMLNYRNSQDAVPPSRPNYLKIEIKLTGIDSAACLDLDVTSQKLHLQSEKPVAYQLDLDLPYEVDHEKGSAKFNKAGNWLLLTLPVLPLETSKSETGVLANNGTLTPDFQLCQSAKSNEDTNTRENPLIEELPDVANATVRTPTTDQSTSKKRRKKKNRKKKGFRGCYP